MKQYIELINKIMDEGVDRPDRTGTGTRGIFGHQMRFNLEDGFPLVTTKRVHLKSIIHELLWFLTGDTNIRYLKDNGVTIWDEWADENGNLGPVYGAQWRHWLSGSAGLIDQIKVLIDGIRSDPYGRRHIVTAWNPAELNKMALPPCHMMFQCYVNEDRLSLQMYQRSCDVFLGLPFNIASYALLTMMIAQVCCMDAHEFVWTGGDVHIYHNHFDQVEEQVSRAPYPLPVMTLNPAVTKIDDFKFDDFVLEGYQYHPAIAGKVAV